MTTFFRFCLGYLCLSLVSASSAKTLTIPGDANSIQEAVEMAASGDEIVVATDWVRWTWRYEKPDGVMERGTPEGITIKDKNLSITGNNQGNKSTIKIYPYYLYRTPDSTFLWIENGRVTLKNLYTDQAPLSRGSGSQSQAAPIHVESGSLNLDNCAFVCNIECRGDLSLKNSRIHGSAWINGYAYDGWTGSVPSILMGPAEKASLLIQDSTVSALPGLSYVNLVIQNLRKGSVLLQNSQFSGGTGDAVYGSFPPTAGSHGAAIQDCTDIRVWIDGCIFQGGNARDASTLRRGYLSRAGSGGSGLLIQNSILLASTTDHPSQLRGGKGGKGIGGVDNTYLPQQPTESPAGQGGHGLTVINSTCFYEGIPLEEAFVGQGGMGGEAYQFNDIYLPPGPDGLPISIDETSVVEAVTTVNSWELF